MIDMPTQKYVRYDLGLDGSGGRFFLGYTGEITELLESYPGRVRFRRGEREVNGKDHHEVLFFGADMFETEAGDITEEQGIRLAAPTEILFEEVSGIDRDSYVTGLKRLASRARKSEKPGDGVLVVVPEHDGDGFRHILQSRVKSVYGTAAKRVHIVSRNEVGLHRSLYSDLTEIIYTTSAAGKGPEMERDVLAKLPPEKLTVVPFESSVTEIGRALAKRPKPAKNDSEPVLDR